MTSQSEDESQSQGKNPLGLVRLLGVHYYVRNLERSRRFYTERLDFAETGASSQQLVRAGKQRSLVFEAGDCAVVCSEPQGEGGRAARYLERHPDGVGTVAFEVSDIRHTFTHLDRHGGNPIDEIQRHEGPDGWLETFSITTPFGDTTFRFVQRAGYAGLFPGMEVYPEPRGGKNRFAFSAIDHVTSNFQTMSPALLWLEHVLGFERFWDVQFHTRDVAGDGLGHGSGLRSAVMWQPESRIKFANNEPYRPFFKDSQINVFHEDNRGDGVQHIALATADILTTVRGLVERGVELMPTPRSYYEMLPARLQREGVESIDENIDELAELGILVDGQARGSYLLQIFLKDSASLYGSSDAGPFFFEIIQRKGDQGFGAGNFRALFESIESEQLERTDPSC
jgi:4-hydroxyphenylpyruvate dioxygenase